MKLDGLDNMEIKPSLNNDIPPFRIFDSINNKYITLYSECNPIPKDKTFVLNTLTSNVKWTVKDSKTKSAPVILEIPFTDKSGIAKVTINADMNINTQSEEWYGIDDAYIDIELPINTGRRRSFSINFIDTENPTTIISYNFTQQ